MTSLQTAALVTLSAQGRQGRARQSRVEQSREEKCIEEKSRKEKRKEEQCRKEKSRAEQSSSEQSGPVLLLDGLVSPWGRSVVWTVGWGTGAVREDLSQEIGSTCED